MTRDAGTTSSDATEQPARTTWRRWLVAGGVVLAATVLLAATAGRSVWQPRCGSSLPEQAQVVPESWGWVVRPGALQDAMLRKPQYRYEGTSDFPFDGVAAAVGGEEAPFGQPQRAVGYELHGGSQATLASDRGLLLPNRGDAVVAAPDVTGDAVWWRTIPGTLHAAIPLDRRVAMVYDAPVAGGRERLAVSAVDLADGARQSCTWVGPAFDGPGDIHPAEWYEARRASVAATVTETGEVTVVHRRDDGSFSLSVVDSEAGNVRVQATTELPALPSDLQAAGEVVVTSAAEDRSLGPLNIPPYLDQTRDLPADQLSLRAFATSDGTLRWEYAAAPVDGDSPTHRIVGATEDLVVVFAARWLGGAGYLDGSGRHPEVSGQVVVLDAATGRPRWQHRPAISHLGPTDARRYGDLVLTQEPDHTDPDQRWLVGYDLDTGEERWRVPDPVAAGGLDRGATLDGDALVLLPAPDEQGAVGVDLTTGATRAYFNGVTVSRVLASDLIGVMFALDSPVDTPDATVLYERVQASG